MYLTDVKQTQPSGNPNPSLPALSQPHSHQKAPGSIIPWDALCPCFVWNGTLLFFFSRNIKQAQGFRPRSTEVFWLLTFIEINETWDHKSLWGSGPQDRGSCQSLGLAHWLELLVSGVWFAQMFPHFCKIKFTLVFQGTFPVWNPTLKVFQRKWNPCWVQTKICAWKGFLFGSWGQAGD